MTTTEFVQALKIQTSDAAIFGTIQNLEHPPGRKPRERDVMLSRWYKNLSESDRRLANAAMQEAAELAVFSFLCILDGVSAIENGHEKGDLHLTYVKGGEELLLNNPAEGCLHDEYNALCQSSDPLPPERLAVQPYEVSSVDHLRSGQSSADGLDLHAVAPEESRLPPSDATAMALPKNEHRKL